LAKSSYGGLEPCVTAEFFLKKIAVYSLDVHLYLFIYLFNNTFGSLDTNYIIFRNVEIFTHKKLQMKKMPKENY
jgi:hypothetical protein